MQISLIFIHGECVTIGCLPLTNTFIKEIYILCVEARNNGQIKIPISIFPARLDGNQFDQLKAEYSKETDKLNLWTDLKKGYDIFNVSKKLPVVQFLKSGRHKVTK